VRTTGISKACFHSSKGQTSPARKRTDSSLALHYQLGSGVSLNRCPTSIFLDVAQAAFAGSGELEDGTLVLEDIIVILSSLIDQVSLQTKKLENESNVTVTLAWS